MEKIRKIVDSIDSNTFIFRLNSKNWLERKKNSLLKRREINARLKELKPALDMAVDFWTDILRHGDSIMYQPLVDRQHQASPYLDALYSGFEETQLTGALSNLSEKKLRRFSNKLRGEFVSIARAIATYNPHKEVSFGCSYPYTKSLQRSTNKAKISMPGIRLPFEVFTYVSPGEMKVTLFRTNQNRKREFHVPIHEHMRNFPDFSIQSLT